MRGFNFNISSLFSNLGSGNAFGSFDFSNYASIKNGSYGKLLKSYYSEQKKTTSPDKTTIDKKNKGEISTDNSALSQLKKEADGLKAASEALNKDDLWKKTDGSYDVEKIAGAVKSFANEYNDLLNQTAKVNSTEVSKNAKYMTSLTNTMSKALSKVGINIGTDGKMSVDEESFKKTNMTSVKALFSGISSYGAQIADKAGEISKDAIMNSSIYGSNGSLSSSLNMFNKWI